MEYYHFGIYLNCLLRDKIQSTHLKWMDRILETLCWTVTLKALEDLNQVKSMDQKCYISCPSYKNHIIIFISFSFKVNNQLLWKKKEKRRRRHYVSTRENSLMGNKNWWLQENLCVRAYICIYIHIIVRWAPCKRRNA